MSDQKYNGYANRSTWAVCLWLDNDEGSYNQWRDRAFELRDEHEDKGDAVSALADEISREHEEFCPPELSGIYLDLLAHALNCVDWREVAESRLDGDEWTKPKEDEDL